MLDYRDRGLEFGAIFVPALMLIAMGFSIGLYVGYRYL